MTDRLAFLMTDRLAFLMTDRLAFLMTEVNMSTKMSDLSKRRARQGTPDNAGPRRLPGSGGPPRERRQTDRRGTGGRRAADQDFGCYSAPFVAHCLVQFADELVEPTDPDQSTAQQAYKQAKRRPH